MAKKKTLKRKPPEQPGLTVWVTRDAGVARHVYIHARRPKKLDNSDGPHCWYGGGDRLLMCARWVRKAMAPHELPPRWKCQKYTARLTP